MACYIHDTLGTGCRRAKIGQKGAGPCASDPHDAYLPAPLCQTDSVLHNRAQPLLLTVMLNSLYEASVLGLRCSKSQLMLIEKEKTYPVLPSLLPF